MPLHPRRITLAAALLAGLAGLGGCAIDTVAYAPVPPGCPDRPWCPTRAAYVKASNTGPSDGFGFSVALSADGSTLAVGAPEEDSGALGAQGDESSNTAPGAGAVYVFTRSGAAWRQQAYLKASNTGPGDRFGASVALSADGSTLAVGAPFEASAATGVGAPPAQQGDNSAFAAGAVYVFARSGEAWGQQAYLKASNTDAGDRFGDSVALAGDGATLAVGAPGEDSAAAGVGGDPVSNALGNSGAIYVFTRVGAAWSAEAYLKAARPGASDELGASLALSADGATLAAGAPFEDGADTGAAGDPASDGALNAGAIYVFVRDGSWRQQAYLKASNTGAGDDLGRAVALSADGATLAAGAPLEDSAATGVDGDPADSPATADAGAVYVFTRSGAAWRQDAYVKASNTGAGDRFGAALALSGDGATLAIGAPGEASAATGIDGDQVSNAAGGAGAIYVFSRSGAPWSPQAYVKAPSVDPGDGFGGAVALSANGATLAAGAQGEDGVTAGVGGDPASDTSPGAGALYLFYQ